MAQLEVFYASFADPEGKTLVLDDPAFRVIFDHEKIVYNDPVSGAINVGDYIYYMDMTRTSAPVGMKALLLDIVRSNEHDYLLFYKTSSGEIRNVNSRNLAEGSIMKMTEEQFKDPNTLGCGICLKLKKSERWSTVRADAYSSILVCGECNTPDVMKECRPCGGVYLTKNMKHMARQDMWLCSACYERSTLECPECRERLYNGGGTFLIAYTERGRGKVCNRCVAEKTVGTCTNCNTPLLHATAVRYMRQGQQPEPLVDLRDEDDPEPTPQVEPPQVVVCVICLEGGGVGRTARTPSVIQAFDYHPENDQSRMNFSGDPNKGFHMLPGYDRTKQPYIIRKTKFDDNAYLLPKRSGDWVGQYKVASFKAVELVDVPQKRTGLFPNQLYIGMELEVELKKKFQKTLTREMVANEFQKSVKDIIYIKHDGSIGGPEARGKTGFEIITHPGTFEWWMKEFPYKRIRALTRYCHSFDTKTCGTHFHLSKNAFTPLHLYKFAQFHYRNREFVNFIAERYSAQYAGYNVEEEKQLTRAAKEKRNQIARKYIAVNMLPEHTVELRYFRGNMKPERIKKNLQFLYATFVFSKTYGIHEMTFLKFVEFVAEWHNENPDDFPELYEYMMKYGEETED